VVPEESARRKDTGTRGREGRGEERKRKGKKGKGEKGGRKKEKGKKGKREKGPLSGCSSFVLVVVKEPAAGGIFLT